ncbi:GtrA family protein [Streptacidiphilus albus]|uniref:GtrA family protein n=1 Tax=Streptacidiphilus albus TaxID=105425 RepID=UPI000689D305
MNSTAQQTAAGAAAPGGSGSGGKLRSQLPVFAVIGVLSTLLYLGLYVLARLVVGEQTGNLIALALSAVANTAANRRFTFGVTGRESALRHQLQGGVAFLIGLGLSSGALALLHHWDARPSRMVELGALIVANVLATLLRFLLLRAWVFKPTPAAAAPVGSDEGES